LWISCCSSRGGTGPEHGYDPFPRPAGDDEPGGGRYREPEHRPDSSGFLRTNHSEDHPRVLRATCGCQRESFAQGHSARPPRYGVDHYPVLYRTRSLAHRLRDHVRQPARNGCFRREDRQSYWPYPGHVREREHAERQHSRARDRAGSLDHHDGVRVHHPGSFRSLRSRPWRSSGRA
jgi:hypothetical protein